MPSSLLRPLLLVLLWGLAATVAGYFELFLHLPPAVVPLLVASLTIGFSLALRRVAWLRTAIADLGVRGLIAPHLIRFIGVSFIWLHAQGRLPAEFAYRAGWGDIAVAITAIPLLVWRDSVGFRRALFIWNVLGALDLLVAVGTGGWLNIVRPGSMIELSHLPLALVPLWLVPVMLSTHFLMLRGGLSPANGSAERLRSRNAITLSPN